MKNPNMAVVGQVWEDQDNRTAAYTKGNGRRRVQVVEVKLRPADRTNDFDRYARVQDLSTGRRTWILEDRLIHQTDGQGRGYVLVQPAKRTTERLAKRPRRA